MKDLFVFQIGFILFSYCAVIITAVLFIIFPDVVIFKKVMVFFIILFLEILFVIGLSTLITD